MKDEYEEYEEDLTFEEALEIILDTLYDEDDDVKELDFND